MSHTAKLTVTLAALVLAATALAGCTAASEPAASAPSEKPAAVKTPVGEKPSEPKPTAPGACARGNQISYMQDGVVTGRGYIVGGGPVSGVLEGTIADHGPREHANGTVALNSAGEISTYTVAPNDVWEQIYKRFCMESPTLEGYNESIGRIKVDSTLQPGQVLLLRPDPTITWNPPKN